MSGHRDDREAGMRRPDAAGAEAEVVVLRREMAELRKVMQGQGARIAWLKQDNARQDREHNHLSAHVRDDFARAFLWLDALACKAVPEALMLATEVSGRVERSAETTVPPHRLGNGKGRPC